MKIDIGLTDQNRKSVADGIAHLLASTFTLYLKTHYFHWNVTGLMFPTLHALFEKQYNELFLATDTLAERIRSLGFSAPGSYSQFKDLTFIKEATTVPKAQEMISQLLADHEAMARNIRELAVVAEKAEDEASLDLLTERTEAHEKTAWMLRSMLEG